MIEASQRTAARVVGIAYPLTFILITVAFFRYNGRALVWKNAAEMARNVITHQREFLAAWGMLAGLFAGNGVSI